jgi:hypothetical protein
MVPVFAFNLMTDTLLLVSSGIMTVAFLAISAFLAGAQIWGKVSLLDLPRLGVCLTATVFLSTVFHAATFRTGEPAGRLARALSSGAELIVLGMLTGMWRGSALPPLPLNGGLR